MNILDVALKDLKRVFRSVFALIMMFGAPLLIAGLLYFAFGGLTGSNGSFSLARTRVVIANLDQANPAGDSFQAGKMLVSFLQNPDLSDILEISMAADEAGARSAVDKQNADVALIIPLNFTRAALAPDEEAAVVLYQDPTLTIGPGIVKDLVNHFMDGFSGAKIAASVVNSASGSASAQVSDQAAAQYASYLQRSEHGAALHISPPAGHSEQAGEPFAIIGSIMAGMMILFVFFMGANGAESIIREHEEGTLARLFTTPTSALRVLAGKFIGVLVTLMIQTTVLLAAAGLIFHIYWGKPGSVVLAAWGLIVAATGFGVMLMSWIKSTRQTGPILGGVLTLTSMVGGLLNNGIPNVPKLMEALSLSMPQGWAMHAWKLSLSGSDPSALLFPSLILTLLGLAFFGIGFLSFRRRFI